LLSMNAFSAGVTAMMRGMSISTSFGTT